MVNRNSKFFKLKKPLIALLCAITVGSTCLAAACAPTEEDTDDTTSSTTTTREDNQLLQNGDFEFYSFPDADDGYHYIRTPNNWSRGGTSSQSMSGVISTSTTAWDKITASTLADALDYNNDLDESSDEYEDEYKNYNAMESSDLLYRDSYVANLTSTQLSNSFQNNMGTLAGYFHITRNTDNGTYWMGTTQVYLDSAAVANDWEDSEFFLDEALTLPLREQFITNPETHYNVESDSNGLYYMDGTTRVTVLEDTETDSYYYEKDDEKIYISNVLMVHNSDSSNNGISQYYSSSSITLEANTSAEISLWVKTSDLKYDKGYLADEDKGAFIEVTQTVNGSDLDSFVIKSINTEKLVAENAPNSNGWINYTILINATDFASSTISINLGLGYGTQSEYVSGYAFFDDVVVTKSIDLTADQTTGTDNTTCTLTDEAEDKTFIADTATVLRKSIVGNGKYSELERSSKDFKYFINLTSTSVTTPSAYTSVPFVGNGVGTTNVTYAGLAYEETTNYIGTKIKYSSATTSTGAFTGLTQAIEQYTLSTGLNGAAVNTSDDIVGIYSADADFGSGKYSPLLTTQFKTNGISNLPQYKSDSNMLVMLSAHGAAYQTTIADSTAFTVEQDNYKILTFWVKTSDLGGNTAATLSIYEQGKREDTLSSFTIDTTDMQTDIGDDENIYNGWVQCFFFVHNDATTGPKTFNIDFNYGITEIASSTSTQYKYGYAAIANMQVLAIDEDVFDLTTAGDYALQFTFTDDDDDATPTEFDAVSGTSNINEGIADPSTYSGVNGGSSLVTDNAYNDAYDRVNSNAWAGLINRDHFDTYADKAAILSAFSTTLDSWNTVFGSDSYQPLIIVNKLRDYGTRAEATEETYKSYYIYNEETGAYEQVAADAEFDPEETYYSLTKAMNYGFISSNQTISSDSYTVISAKVMVSDGATAHIYLVDSDSKDVMSFVTPDYTYHYDDEGNVLDEAFDDDWSDSEHRSHIVYLLRDDGLYEDSTGKLFANLHNYIRTYNHYSFQQLTFYKNNARVDFDDLQDGEIYYSDEACTVVARHFLSTTDGTRVYEYEDGKYYYLVDYTDDDENTYKVRDEVVESFATDIAKTTPTASDDFIYHTEVAPTNGKWVTVNFIVRTGSEDKSYRIELWSGERGQSGTVDAEGNEITTVSGAVAFDYSSYSVTETNYATLLSEYEGKIIDAYKTLLFDKQLGGRIESNSENIAYYEKLITDLIAEGNNGLTAADLNAIKDTYTAYYYTYSLFDSSAYIPFNADTAADGETGYEYTASSYSETLAYFKYNVQENGSVSIYNTFVDYTTIDQDIENGSITDDTTDDEDDTTDNSNVWLLISSIILVVVLLFTIASILVRDWWKKRSRKVSRKIQSRNAYRQKERYIRKLGLVKTEDEVVNDNKDAEATETKAEEPVEETVETPVEEVKTEEPAVEEKAPEAEAEAEVVAEPAKEEAPVEAPAEEVKAEAVAEPAKEEAPVEAPAEEVKAEAKVEKTEESAETPAEEPKADDKD